MVRFLVRLLENRSEERRVGKECRSRCDWSSDVCSSDLGARQKHAARRLDLRICIEFREAQGPFHSLREDSFGLLQSPDIIPGGVADLDIDLACDRWFDFS